MLVLCVTTPSYSRKKPKNKVAAVSADSASMADDMHFKYFYFEAINQQLKGNYASAFELLNRSIRIKPHAAEGYFARAPFYAALNLDSLALADYKKAISLRPDNNIYVERLAQYYVSRGKYDEATEMYERMYQNNYNRTEVLSALSELYYQAKRYDKVIESLNRLETIEGSNEQISISKMSVYEAQGKKKEAYNELRMLVQKHPYEMNYRVMLGNWLLQNGRKEDALKTYTDVLKEEPDNTFAQLSMLDYYKAEKQDSLAERLVVNLLTNKKTPEENKITLMRQMIMNNEDDGRDSSEVLSLFKLVLSEPQKTSQMTELYAAYMTLKGMPQDSVNVVLHRILEINPENVSARVQLIEDAWNKQNFDKVISLCKSAIEYSPEQIEYYYYLGFANVQKDNDDAALDAFRRGIRQITPQSNAIVVSDFYAVMGDILHGKGFKDEAYAAYDSCLQWKKDNIACLNNYAYYLSIDNRDLKKAEEMSHKAITAEPNNATYLDTYAWILFRQNRYEEAKTYIDLTLKNDTAPGATLLEHAGDVYAMCGQTDKAVEYWQQSLKKNPNSALVERKIKMRKYIEK